MNSIQYYYGARHGGQWAWKHDLIERYFKRTKFTSFGRVHILDTIHEMLTHICIGRPGRRSYLNANTEKAILDRLAQYEPGSDDPRHFSRVCYINGKMHRVYDIETWRQLKHMQKMERKLKSLEG